MSYDDFIIHFRDYLLTHPGERLGQAAFNVMHNQYPEQANKYRDTKLDPFHHNHRAGLFIDTCLADALKGTVDC